jgi:hypothetical protein
VNLNGSADGYEGFAQLGAQIICSPEEKERGISRYLSLFCG